MKKYFTKKYMSAMLGTAIEYYDVSLYGYMAPILVQVFMPHLDKISAYFYYFLFELLAALAQIFGARFFGKMGDNIGRKKTMYISIMGMCITTFIIAILPTYYMVGILAMALFVTCRAIQSFFLAGEYNGAAIYCLEHEPDHKKHGLTSGIYSAFLVSGILAAALVASVINHFGTQYFRIAYAISFILAILTYKMCLHMVETPEYIQASSQNKSHRPQKSGYHSPFVIVALISLFFGILYALPTRIFNSILPLVIDISTETIMIINSVLLVLYMVLLPIFGALADKLGAIKALLYSTLAVALCCYPCIILIETRQIIHLIVAKTVFTVLTAAFAAPLHAFTQPLFSTRRRYQMLSIAYSTGKLLSILIISSVIRLLDYQHNLHYIAYIMIAAALVLLSSLYGTRNRKKSSAEMQPQSLH